MTQSVTELQDVQQQMAELARKAADVRERVERVRPAATSADGAVTVTVASTGTLTGISFGASARGMDLDALAALILRTANEAHRRAAIETQAALAELTGADSTPVREVGSFIPPAEDDQTAPATAPSADPAADPEDEGFAGRGRS